MESGTSVLPVAVIRRPARFAQAKVRPSRLACVDLLRGVVMVLMALDHTRDFFTNLRFSPEDLAHTSGALFFTRWVTHFCAPVFFLLAGASAYLSLSRGKSVAELSGLLWRRGLWLVLLELTVMAYGWTYVLPFSSSDVVWSGALWSLGWSMVAMALLVRLPLRWTASLGVGIVLVHNLLDRVNSAAFGRFADLWRIVYGHGGFWIVPRKCAFLVGFSLLPWLGVMAVGYALGALLRTKYWSKLVFRIGAALTIAFLVLRIFHLYGNSQPTLHPWGADAAGPWRVQPTLVLTMVSFFNTSKFPPSLQFLLMTLGPALMALAWFDKVNAERGLAKVLVVFGRVPLFYYVVHIYVIHTLAVYVGLICKQKVGWLLYGGFIFHTPPAGYGHNLPFTYAIWAAVVVFLYPLCKWFADFKRKHADKWWLSYL